ncbi:MAG: hypothetical protein HC850_02285 [Rhodomicrobium sp.]|nr:hypothetical protein [Rhodomicrobium sp.]
MCRERLSFYGPRIPAEKKLPAISAGFSDRGQIVRRISNAIKSKIVSAKPPSKRRPFLISVKMVGVSRCSSFEGVSANGLVDCIAMIAISQE